MLGLEGGLMGLSHTWINPIYDTVHVQCLPYPELINGASGRNFGIELI
jgi:hypothetical protein